MPASPANDNSPRSSAPLRRIRPSTSTRGRLLGVPGRDRYRSRARSRDRDPCRRRLDHHLPRDRHHVASNTSGCSDPLTYVEDSTLPADPDRLQAAGADQQPASASFTFSGTDTGGSGVASLPVPARLDQAADWGTCTSPQSLLGLAEGSHKFEVRAIDQAGNIDAEPGELDLDDRHHGAATSIDSGPSGLTNDSTPTFTFSSEPGASFAVLDRHRHSELRPLLGRRIPHPGLAAHRRLRNVRREGGRRRAERVRRDPRLRGRRHRRPGRPRPQLDPPASPANEQLAKIVGSAPAGTTVHLYANANCSGAPWPTSRRLLCRPAWRSASPITRAPRSAPPPPRRRQHVRLLEPLTYVEDSTAPDTQITAGPPARSDSSTSESRLHRLGWRRIRSRLIRMPTLAAPGTVRFSTNQYEDLADGSHTSKSVRPTPRTTRIRLRPQSSGWSTQEPRPTPTPRSRPRIQTDPPPGQAQLVRISQQHEEGHRLAHLQVTGPGSSSRAPRRCQNWSPSARAMHDSPPGARQVRLRQRSIRPASMSAVGAGEVEVPIKLTRSGRGSCARNKASRSGSTSASSRLTASTTIWKLQRDAEKAPSRMAKTPQIWALSAQDDGLDIRSIHMKAETERSFEDPST